MRVGDALDQRADELEQAPDRRDADRAGADEAHLAAKTVSATFGDLAVPITPAVSIGTKPAHEIEQAASMAMPTEMPTRCPAPASASESRR